MTSVAIIVVVIVVIISVIVITAVMFFVNFVLSHCYLVYFASIKPNSIARRTIVDISFISSNLLYWC